MVIRNELVGRISASPATCWLVEAGAGFGKTTLIEQVRSASLDPFLVVRCPSGASDASPVHAIANAAFRALRPELAEALLGIDPLPSRLAGVLGSHSCSVAFDDVDQWEPEAGTFLLELASELEFASEAGLCFLTRRLPPHLDALRRQTQSSTVLADELHFSAEEVASEFRAQELDAASLADPVHEMTAGWPIAVGSVVARMRTAPDPASILRALGRHGRVIDDLVQRYTTDLSDDDQSAVSTLTQLPFFDDYIADAIGTAGLLDRLASAGVPITRQADGWSVIPGQFATSLVRPGVSIYSQAAIDHLVDRNEVLAAITACITLGQNRQAAEIVAGLSFDQETRLDPSALNAAMTTIGDVADETPRALLVQAQINVSYGQFDDGAAMLERAVKVLADADPDLTDPVHLEVLLEAGLWRVYDGHEEEAGDLLARCEGAQALTTDGPLRARLLDLQGMISQLDPTEDALENARRALLEALEIWRREREPRAAAATSFRLASTVLFRLGRRQEALSVLDNLPLVGQMTTVNKARLALERAISLPYVGRSDEVPATLEETRRIATLLGHDWLLGWAIWAETVAESFAGRGDRVSALTEEFLEHNYFLVNPVTQGGMWAEVAQAHTRCGNEATAKECLERARAIEGIPGAFLPYAEAYVAAHFEKPSDALEQLNVLEAPDSGVDIERRWTLPLLRALCHERLGDTAHAIESLHQAEHAAAALGQASLPSIVERAIVERINSSTPSRGGDEAVVLDVTESLVELTVFDSFGQAVDGRPIDVPAGNVATLLKLLVLGEGRLLLDQLVDPMWPDTSLEVGRRRLRNVLRRLRTSCGEIVEREADSLRLDPEVGSDFARARAAARMALSGARTLDAVAAAIKLNNRPLLPGDRYDDWAESARADHAALLTLLYDAQADLAERSGDIDLAVAALEAANGTGGHDLSRVRHACDILRSVGRNAAALALAQRHGAG